MAGRSVAFFDLDGTLYRGRTGYAAFDFAAFLTSRGLFDRGTLGRLVAFGLARGAGLLAHEPFARQALRGYAEGLRGRSAAAVEGACASFWDSLGERAWFAHAAPLVAAMRARCDALILISGSPAEPLECLAELFGFDAVHATTCPQEDGAYLGRCGLGDELATAAAKTRLLERLRAEWDFDPARSFAFGDSEGDLPLLEAVDPRHAFLLVGPLGGFALRKLARRRGWWAGRAADLVRAVDERLAEVCPVALA